MPPARPAQGALGAASGRFLSVQSCSTVAWPAHSCEKGFSRTSPHAALAEQSHLQQKPRTGGRSKKMADSSHRPDPVLKNSSREAIVIMLIWLGAAIFTCLYCYFNGYIRPGHDLGAQDLRPIWGIPRWFFWGVVVPWLVCGVISVAFAAFFMADDDLGEDHAAELDADIRAEAKSHKHG